MHVDLVQSSIPYVCLPRLQEESELRHQTAQLAKQIDWMKNLSPQTIGISSSVCIPSKDCIMMNRFHHFVFLFW
jgi:hypothetical protein